MALFSALAGTKWDIVKHNGFPNHPFMCFLEYLLQLAVTSQFFPVLMWWVDGLDCLRRLAYGPNRLMRHIVLDDVNPSIGVDLLNTLTFYMIGSPYKIMNQC